MALWVAARRAGAWQRLAGLKDGMEQRTLKMAGSPAWTAFQPWNECRSRSVSSKGSFDDDYDAEDEEELKAGNADIFRGVSNKQHDLLIDKAMKQKGRPQQEPLPKMKWNFDMRVVDVNRTFKVTKAGGIQSFTAFVVCGNYEGIAGYGKGKAADVSFAVDKAYRRSLKNLHFFDIYRGRTIYHSQESKYGSTKIRLWPAKKATGIVASDVVGDIVYMAGYKDMKSKVIGSRHPHNTVKALFKALCSIESPETEAPKRV